MSGHSKWSQIKRKKAATDAARGRAFSKIIKEITLAARAGGGDPEGNPRLRSAIQAAKGVNMPANNIERAIQRGAGAGEGSSLEEAHYEAYAPGGVALLIEVATDNKNRTGSDVRSLLTRHGGSLAAVGAVAYLFRSRGVIEVPAESISEDDLIEVALEAGAEDVTPGAEHHEVQTPPAAFEDVKRAIESRGVTPSHAEVTRLATLQVPLSEKEAASTLKIVDALEELEDVQKVYANFSISDDVLTRLGH